LQFDNLGNILLIGFLLLCALPVLIVAIVAFLLYRATQSRLDTFLSPDISQLQAEFQKQRSAHPNASTETLVGKIIHKQALKAGIVGAITGLGGFITLPIALPIDIIASLRIQAALVDFIASIYGAQPGERETKIRTYLVMSASGQVAERTSGVILRFLLRVIGKSFSKLIPFIGAFVGFAVNYAIARGIGYAAVQWYSRKSLPEHP
jgi:hypothetical protein